MQELIAYQADSNQLRDIVDVGLSILLKVDIDAFVNLKEKYLPHGLKLAIRNNDDPFWKNEGVNMWEEVQQLVSNKLVDGFWFGQHPESPSIVGIFPRD